MRRLPLILSSLAAAAAMSTAACGGSINVPAGGGVVTETTSASTTATTTASATTTATATATDDPTNTPQATGTITTEPETTTATTTTHVTTTNTPASIGSAVEGTGTYEVGEATVPALQPGVYTSTGPAAGSMRCTFIVLRSQGGTQIASGASSGEPLRVTLSLGQVFLTRGCAPWVAADGTA